MSDPHDGIEFHKRHLGDGRVELRIVLPPSAFVPGGEPSGDYSLHGIYARERATRLYLASAAGIARTLGAETCADMLREIWAGMRLAFAAERETKGRTT